MAGKRKASPKVVVLILIFLLPLFLGAIVSFAWAGHARDSDFNGWPDFIQFPFRAWGIEGPFRYRQVAELGSASSGLLLEGEEDLLVLTSGSILRAFRYAESAPILSAKVQPAWELTRDGEQVRVYDAKEDVLLAVGRSEKKDETTLHVLTVTLHGEVLTSFTLSIPAVEGYRADATISDAKLADLDLDGSFEIIAQIDSGYSAGARSIVAINTTSPVEVRWAYLQGDALTNPLVVTDLNFDGYPEIINGGCTWNNMGWGDGAGGNTSTFDAYSYIVTIDRFGYEIDTWNSTRSGCATPFVLQLDERGPLDVITFESHEPLQPNRPELSYTGRAQIHLIDPFRHETRRTFFDRDNSSWTSWKAGDVDGDGEPEIIAATSDGRILTIDGALSFVSQASMGYSQIWTVEDFDNDGRLEILAGTGEARRLAILSSSLDEQWAEESQYLPGEGIAPLRSEVLVKDLDGDRRSEIIVIGDVTHIYSQRVSLSWIILGLTSGVLALLGLVARELVDQALDMARKVFTARGKRQRSRPPIVTPRADSARSDLAPLPTPAPVVDPKASNEPNYSQRKNRRNRKR